jgi:flagellar basal body-associated protein FliL
MEAPGSFILLAIVLSVLFAACMVTGAVWLFFGWRKKARSVQLLSALPFGVGLFIVGPLLLIALVMVVWWLMADWRAIPQSPAPAPQEQKEPNQGAAGKGEMALLFHIARPGRALPEPGR